MKFFALIQPDEDVMPVRAEYTDDGVTKNIGIMCYKRSLNANPKSVLYGNIGGTDELDLMTEEFDP